jgi:hypothetical protein
MTGTCRDSIKRQWWRARKMAPPLLGEEPDANVVVVWVWGQQERRFRVVQLSGDRLHLLIGETIRTEDHSSRIPRQGQSGE